MRNLKRALSLTLASVMLLGMMVVGTSAASFPDVDDNDNIEAIEVLNAVGVMIGDNGNFKPDAPVTRNEMAVIMTNMMGLNPKDFAGTCPFTDVSGTQAWAQNYVAACYANGIIAGRSATVFDGQATVTAVEAASMMMRALGYFKYPGDYEGGFTAATVRQAATIRLFDGVAGSASSPMTRNDVAQLALNTLEADKVEFTGNMGWEINGIAAGYQSKYESVRDYTNNQSGYNYTGDSGTTHQRQYLQLLEDLYDGKLTKANDADDYGMPATTWTYDGKDVVTTAKAPEYTWTTGIEDITLDDLYKALGDKTGPLVVFENGTPTDGTLTGNTLAGTTCIAPTKGATASSDKKLAPYKGATIYAVDKFTNVAAPGTSVDISTAPDGKVDSLIVVYPYLAQITKVTAATDKADRKITLDVWNDNAGAKISGVTYETNDFQKDDFVLVYPDGSMSATEAMNATAMSNNIIDVKLADVVKGKVATVKNDSSSDMESLTIDGNKYTVAGPLMATNGNNDNQLVKDSTFGFTSEYTLYLSNGYIMGSEGVNGAKDIDNIVYVTSNSYNPVNDFGVDGTAHRVQVIRMDGTVENLKAESQLTGVPAKGGFYAIADADNNDKYTFTPATASSGINNSTVYFGTNAVNGAVTMKADDKSIAIDTVGGKSSAYLTANTRILFVKDSRADLKTSMVMGPIRQNVADDSVVLLSKDDSGNYEVEVLVINAEKASTSDDVVYVDNTPKGNQADGVKLYKIYDAKTGESKEVPAKPADVVNGFATYSVNDDGQYKFTATTVASSKNADGSYAITSAITKYGNLLTEGSLLVDVDASDARIINNTGSSDNDNLTLSDIDKAAGLEGFAYVVDEKVVAIVVNAYDADSPLPASTTPTLSASTGSKEIKKDADVALSVTVSNASAIGTAGGSLSYVWKDNGTTISGADAASLSKTDLSVGEHTIVCTVSNKESGKTAATATYTATVVVFPKAWDDVVSGTLPTGWTVTSNGTKASTGLTIKTLPNGFTATAVAGQGTGLGEVEFDGTTTNQINAKAAAAGTAQLKVTITYTFSDASTKTMDYVSGDITIGS